MTFHDSTLERTRLRVAELITGFGEWVTEFVEADLFTGPSRYFHLATIHILRTHLARSSGIQGCLDDEEFYESLYATLSSWGLHRMGKTKTKLVELPALMAGFKSQSKNICNLSRVRLAELAQEDVFKIQGRVWEIIFSLDVGVGKSKLVAGSKALHHVLPDLVPPIDRQYTVRFFFNQPNAIQGEGREEAAFRVIYPAFAKVARECAGEIKDRLDDDWNTSTTKVVDNAIVGYGLKVLKVPEED